MMSNRRDKLTLFVFLFCWALSSLPITIAHLESRASPPNDQFRYSRVDAVRVYVNDDVYTMPPVGYFRYTGIPITPADVTSARIEGVGPGYGCFFITSNTDSFVSQTFFSSSTADYNSDFFEPITFESNFPGAVQLMCFRLPNPRITVPASLVMVEYVNKSGDTVFGFRPVMQDLRVSELNIGYTAFPSGATLVRAAIVHAGGEGTFCVVRRSFFRAKRFSMDMPILRPVKNFKGIQCSSG